MLIMKKYLLTFDLGFFKKTKIPIISEKKELNNEALITGLNIKPLILKFILYQNSLVVNPATPLLYQDK